MNHTPPVPPTQTTIVVAVKFDGGRSEKAYDYLSTLPLKAGDKVIVETFRGESPATVVEVKEASDRAEKFVVGYNDGGNA